MTATKVALEALAVALRTDLAHAERRVTGLSRWAAVAPVGDETYVAATLLQYLYSAIEAITERALKVFDGYVATGEDSHLQLLERALSAREGIRGPILPPDDLFDELRRFRHRFRRRYDDELEPAYFHPLIQSAVKAWPSIRAHLVGFAEFVDDCAKVAP
jgi:hypothetical protein